MGLMVSLPVIWVWAIDELDLRRLNVEVQGQSGAFPQTACFESTLTANSISSSNRHVADLLSTGDASLPPPPSSVGNPCRSTARTFNASVTRAGPLEPSLNGVLALPLLQSLWSSPELRIAIFSSLLFLGMAFALALNVLRSVRLFAASASQLEFQRVGDGSKQARFSIPELAPVRSAIERLTLDLNHMAEQVRLDNDDNVHAMRTPLATIVGSLNAIRRGLPAREVRAWRALQFVATSAERLSAMIDVSRKETGELVSLFVTPRLRLDFRRILQESVDRIFEATKAGETAFVYNHVDQVFVRAPAGVLEAAMDSVLVAVRSAQLSGSSVVASLMSTDGQAQLKIDLSRNGEFAKGRDWSCLTIEPSGERRYDPYGNARRTITLLGGCLDTRASDRGGWSISITLPRDKS